MFVPSKLILIFLIFFIFIIPAQIYCTPANLMSLCLKLNYNYYKSGSYDIKRPIYKDPFSVNRVESRASLIFFNFFIIKRDLESCFTPLSPILLFDKFISTN